MKKIVLIESWKTSKHKDVACVDCHYAPGEKQTREAKFKGLAQVFSYLSEKPEDVSKFARISDISCTTSKCHPKTGEGKEGKKVSYTEYERSDKSKAIVSIIHITHDEKTIEGQKLHCQTCHSHQSDACFLCHLSTLPVKKEVSMVFLSQSRKSTSRLSTSRK